MSHHSHQCLHVQVGGIEHIGSAPKHPSLPPVSKVKFRALWIVSLTRCCLFSLDCLPRKWIIKYLFLHNWLASLSTKSSRFNSLPSDLSFSLLCGCRSVCNPVYAESESYDGLSHYTAPHCGLSPPWLSGLFTHVGIVVSLGKVWLKTTMALGIMWLGTRTGCLLPYVFTLRCLPQWFSTWGSWLFHRGQISAMLHIRYLWFISVAKL